jgi:hypothetical protein
VTYQTLDIAACTDLDKAQEEARFLLWATKKQGAFWEETAHRLLTGYLMAAALDHGGDIATLLRWAADPADARPLQLLRDAGAAQLARDCEQILTGSDPTRANVVTVVRKALRDATDQR